MVLDRPPKEYYEALAREEEERKRLRSSGAPLILIAAAVFLILPSSAPYVLVPLVAAGMGEVYLVYLILFALGAIVLFAWLLRNFGISG